jgi:hypothetical protein
MRGAVQYQSLGFGHRPNDRFDSVSPQLLQSGHALVAIDHHIAIRLAILRDDHDRSLLAAAEQRSQQPLPLLWRLNAQMLSAPLQLMKL